MASTSGRHAIARPTSAQPFPFRRAITSGGAMVVALGLAATMAIPAVSASATVASESSSSDQVTNFIEKAQNQRLQVDSSVTDTSVSRDSSSVHYAAALKTANGVFGGSALRATPLSLSAHMVITPPDISGGGNAVVQYALQFVGKVPYILGGDSPSTGFSCDTFVRYVYAQFGVALHGDAVVEAHMGTVIPQSQAVEGDLVYYPHQHIGFYDGAGGIIDAPKPGTDVSHRAIWGHPQFIRL